MELPKEIAQAIGSQGYRVDSIGESGSEVRIYDRLVLKIQPPSGEAETEAVMARWLKGRLPVPSLWVYTVQNGFTYTLMSRVEGKMLCSMEYLNQPGLVIRLAADGIRQLWTVDVRDCPCRKSRLTERLKAAEYRVANGLVDIANTEPETFGPDGFQNPEELLAWLKTHRPEEDIVLTHGDCCLPNLFAKGNEISGFIDLGKAGPADRWQDIAIAIRSLQHNFDGTYTHGEKLFDFEPTMLTEALGIRFDEEKNRYYRLLDELF